MAHQREGFESISDVMEDSVDVCDKSLDLFGSSYALRWAVSYSESLVSNLWKWLSLKRPKLTSMLETV